MGKREEIAKIFSNMEKGAKMNTQPGMITPQPSFYNLVDVKWSWLMAMGFVMLILGTLAIVFPAATSVSMTILFGLLLLTAGVIRLVTMFHNKGVGDFFLRMLGAILYLTAGILLLVYPLEGTLTLTMVLIIFFMAQGLASIFISLTNRDRRSWGWMLFNGIVSLAVGGLLWAELPSSATWAIGLLVGISLIFDGWALIATAWTMKDVDQMAPA
jgi:uncharacterized membrane protein HdeD (DUF308 family)